MIRHLKRQRQRTLNERAALLAEYDNSGLTQREFAARNGLSLTCLSIWLRNAQVKNPGTVPPILGVQTDRQYNLRQLDHAFGVPAIHRNLRRLRFPEEKVPHKTSTRYT